MRGSLYKCIKDTPYFICVKGNLVYFGDLKVNSIVICVDSTSKIFSYFNFCILPNGETGWIRDWEIDYINQT